MKGTTVKGMGNPGALVVASQIASTKGGQKAISEGAAAAKWVFIGLGTYFVGAYAWRRYKKLRAERYANENAGDPHVVAAAIIHSSFTRLFDGSSFLSLLIPDINIWTNETALYKIATQVKDVKLVSYAYNILFDRNLFFDVKKGLSTSEMRNFWAKINAPTNAGSSGELYPKESKLYCAVRSGITVKRAEKKDNKWKVTNRLYDNFKHGEYMGKVIATGIYKHSDGRKENFYIIEARDWDMLGIFYEKGFVLQHQVTNKKI